VFADNESLQGYIQNRIRKVVASMKDFEKNRCLRSELLFIDFVTDSNT
jgi:hypothetical protein